MSYKIFSKIGCLLN